MPTHTLISVAKLPSGEHFYLVGTRNGELGEIDDGHGALSSTVVSVTQLVGPASDTYELGDPTACDLSFATPIDIPGGVFNKAGKLQTTPDLQAALAASASATALRFVAILQEAQRRMFSIDIEAGGAFLKVDSPFGNAAFAGAHVRLQLWNITLAAVPAVDIAIDISAFARLDVPGGQRGVSLTVRLAESGEARLRLDADDLNISLPEFSLPSFDLAAKGFNLALADGMNGAALLFERLGAAASVTFAYPGAPPHALPRLAMQVRTGTSFIDWAIVQHDFEPDTDWATIGTKLAILSAAISLKGGAAVIEIDQIKLASLQTGLVIEGVITAQPILPEIEIDGPQRFGPLEVSWNRLTMQPFLSVSTGSGDSLRARFRFSHLTLRVYDDPTASLSFSGIVDIDPSGAHLVELHLEAPFPITLVANAAQAMARSGASVMKVLIDFAQLAAEQVPILIEILGKIALAAGRAALFIGDQVAGAFSAVGDLLQAGLAAISEMVGAMLKQLAQLAAGSSAFAVELRISTNPFELRQILVTMRADKATDAVDTKVLGLHVTVPGYWKPGLLIDFVNEPGAYLVLSCDTDPNNTNVATISTDLWLGQADAKKSTALRDTDGSAANPPPRSKDQAPLISLILKRADTNGASSTMLVLAGIHRGQPVFFKQLQGDAVLVNIPGTTANVRSMAGPFLLKPIDDMFSVDVKFEKDRILPLLGMGEPGDKNAPPAGQAQPSFLEKLQGSLSNVIWVKSSDPWARLNERAAGVDLVLGLKAAGLETSMTLRAKVSLDTLELTLEGSNEFTIESRRIEETALGMVWVVEQIDDGERLTDKQVAMFKLGFAGGQSGFELNTKVARMELRFNALSSDGKGVVFEVTTFKIGPGGLDLMAKVKDNPVRLNGINVPFRFTEGALEIKGGKLVSAMIAGRGSLPPDLIGAADCTVALTFGDEAGKGIVLQSGKVELDKKNDPVICHASRFTLTITNLDIAFVNDGGYHFYYLVTGSLRFTPKSGEFESGLLQYLDGVEMNLERTPLSADPRVLLKHISFQKTLNPKKSFNLFNLFTFELRGFGYHPASPKFGGDPAVNISGQIKFVEMGDLMQPSIDFHGLWIAAPAKGQSLPRVKADGLGIDLNMKGSIRIRGTVIAVDPDTKTVEGSDLAPPEYNTYGFLGRGEFDIPGWGTMGASLGFIELERKDQPGERRKSFYFFADKKKLAIEIPTVVWNFYLREVGFGMGFRYTLDAINAADKATSIPKLINALDDVSKRQGDLHKFSAWKPEPEGDRVTLALKGAIQVYPAAKEWNEKQEELAENPFLFDIVAAIRSDFTLFMGLRGWIGTNYIDYLNDKDGLRSNPGLRGYLYISAPQQRLLARMIGDSKGYIGDRLPALKKTGETDPPMRAALKSVDWSATLFIKPGLFHYELGWPNQLVARLFDEPNMRVTVRGGMIFRAADDGLLWGYNIEAQAFFHFGGALQIGPIGVCVEATLNANLVARVLCYLSWRFKGSLIYGLIALDATLAVSVRAWMEIDLGFTSFTLRISFSVSLQFSAAVEIAISTEGVGARLAARVALSVFGCTLSVSVGFVAGKGELEDARARVQRFLAMSITAEEPDAAPAVVHASGDARIDADAKNAQKEIDAPVAVTKPNNDPELRPSQVRSSLGRIKRQTNFWLVLHQAVRGPLQTPPDSDYAYALLLPRDACPDPAHAHDPDFDSGAFYAAPSSRIDGESKRDELVAAHILSLPNTMTNEEIAVTLASLRRLKRYVAKTGEFEDIILADGNAKIDAITTWNDTVSTVEGHAGLTLAHLFDECFLSDTEWMRKDNSPPYRVTTAWAEPAPRVHRTNKTTPSGDEHERNSQRDMAQRARAADTASNPVVDAVHQARSTVLAMFIEQFESLAKSGMPPLPGNASVCSLGLVFYGHKDDLAALGKLFIIKNETDAPGNGRIDVFNPAKSWFEYQDPVLAADRFAIAHDGIKLDWRLTTEFASATRSSGTENSAMNDPEQFLHHYEIARTIEGHEFTPEIIRVKPTATIGKRDERDKRYVELIAPDWQFVDDLSSLAPDLRLALLPPSNDEALALEAAKAWVRLMPGRPSLDLTYTITPVDIAGTRGLPKSFVVPVYQPSPPLRPAEAELRFIVTGMGVGKSGEPWDSDLAPAANLAVVMALKDASASPGKRKSDVKRYYELIADPEDISPSGHYGTDGLTERRLGIASTFGLSADARRWRIELDSFEQVTDANGKVPADTFIDPLEPDHDTLATYPHWALLAGKTTLARIDAKLEPLMAAPVAQHKNGPSDFLESLWRRDGNDGARIATRFALVTIQEEWVKVHGETKPRLVRSMSRPVAVNIEVRIEARDPAKQEIGLLRPEAFEWPVHLDMPPHQDNQVHVQTGFARFRVPPAHASLAEVASSGQLLSCLQVRDPERRILTEVSFDAAPDFDAPGVAIGGAHASSIAGFDLHELDLDDLAPLDTDSAPGFASNAKTWSRARRVARIERVSAEVARLMPDSNRDWPGWHAHYPSETWRLLNRAPGRKGQSSPRRAAWHSAAESTIRFAERVPRNRLMPTASEAAIAELMAKGQPTRLVVEFDPFVLQDPAEAALAALHKAVTTAACLGVSHPCFDRQTESPDPFAPLTGAVDQDKFIITWNAQPGENAFTSARIRAALMGLVWAVPAAQLDDLNKTLSNDRRLTFGLKISGTITKEDGGFHTTGQTMIPLVLNGPLHAVLEEVLGELEYSVQGSDSSLYRRYVVSVQPVHPSEAKNLAGFLAETSAETDPYGWAALQQLGLAATIKLFDRNLDNFVEPAQLHRHLNAVFDAALKRYAAAYKDLNLGQPFVDVLLRPGNDRVAGPFDAVLTNGSVEADSDALSLADASLAIAQLSLRPVPAPARHYGLFEMGWEAADWPHQLKGEEPVKNADQPKTTITRSLDGYELHFEAHSTLAYEVVRIADGAMLNIAPGAKAGVLQVLSWPKSVRKTVQPDPTLRFFMRHADDARAAPQLKAKVKTTTTVKTEVPGHPDQTTVESRTVETVLTLAELSAYAPDPTNFPTIGMCAIGLGIAPPAYEPIRQPAAKDDSPYERFAALDAAMLAAVFTSPANDPTDSIVPEPGTPRMEQMPDAFKAFDTLRVNLASVNRSLAWPEGFAALVKELGAYLPWQQRFLDHGASPDTAVATLPFALAAPVKANPLQLASDAEGQIRLSFLHADRWAHARVYAVRPTPRYQNLALGAGYFDSQGETEQLVTERLVTRDAEKDTITFKVPIGYALAVSPRTERIEPPVILGSSLVTHDYQDERNQPATENEWQLVLAQHGEEALASSNRPLFARLQTEGTALSFLREYRDAAWPSRLARAMRDKQEAILCPPRDAALPEPARAMPTGIDALALRQLASDYPSLWKGAQVVRIGQLPPHYRVTAFAVARAGLVVSRVVAATQDATPRRPLKPTLRLPAGLNDTAYTDEAKRLLGKPQLTLSRDANHAIRIDVTALRLVSHENLTETAARGWITDDALDVGWWPDPNVRYTLLRRGPADGGKCFEDEDAVVNLVASPAADARDSSPVVVRCRGNRFSAGEVIEDAANDDMNPRVNAEPTEQGQQFLLTFQLKTIAENERQFLRFTNDAADPAKVRTLFNTGARRFAVIGLDAVLSVGPFQLLLPSDGLEESQASINAMAQSVRQVGIELAGQAPSEALDAIERIADEIDGEAKAMTSLNQWNAIAQRLTRERFMNIAIKEASANEQLVEPDLGNGIFGVALKLTGTEVLSLFDLPDKNEAEAAMASGHPVASRLRGRLWAACRERLMGGADQFVIRAVDMRNAIQKTKKNGDPIWEAPGEVEVTVSLPEWTNW